MAVWKKFEERRAAIEAAVESPVEEAAASSVSSIDLDDTEDKDEHMLDDEDVGADDRNDPLPYIDPPFMDEPLNDEDICKYKLALL